MVYRCLLCLLWLLGSRVGKADHCVDSGASQDPAVDGQEAPVVLLQTKLHLARDYSSVDATRAVPSHQDVADLKEKGDVEMEADALAPMAWAAVPWSALQKGRQRVLSGEGAVSGLAAVVCCALAFSMAVMFCLASEPGRPPAETGLGYSKPSNVGRQPAASPAPSWKVESRTTLPNDHLISPSWKAESRHTLTLQPSRLTVPAADTPLWTARKSFLGEVRPNAYHHESFVISTVPPSPRTQACDTLDSLDCGTGVGVGAFPGSLRVKVDCGVGAGACSSVAGPEDALQLYPNMVMPNDRPRFLTSCSRIRQLLAGTGDLDLFGGSGKKLLHVTILETPDGARELKLKLFAAARTTVKPLTDQLPRHRWYDCLEVYADDLNVPPFGVLQIVPGSDDVQLLCGGAPALRVEAMDAGKMALRAMSMMTGKKLAEAQADGDSWRVQVERGEDAILMLSCMLSRILLMPWSWTAALALDGTRLPGKSASWRLL